MQNKLGSMIKRRDLSGITLIASDNTVKKHNWTRNDADTLNSYIS